MGIFFDGNEDNGGTEMEGLAHMIMAGIFRSFLSLFKPSLRSIQSAQDRAKLNQAAGAMQQSVLTPGAPAVNPAAQPPLVARANASPPPKRPPNSKPANSP
jgi:hypothetical protein